MRYLFTNEREDLSGCYGCEFLETNNDVYFYYDVITHSTLTISGLCRIPENNLQLCQKNKLEEMKCTNCIYGMEGYCIYKTDVQKCNFYKDKYNRKIISIDDIKYLEAIDDNK
jgi:hypothetical protein